MNIADFSAALVRRFPKSADEIAAWKPDYENVLHGLTDDELSDSLRATLARWTKSWPPKPAEIIRQRRSAAAHGRHALTVTSMDLFGKPMGDGKGIADLDDKEFREWQRQNGELFLARLGYWQRMRTWMGDDEAAAALKRAQNDDECYRVFDQWRHGEPIDPKRAPERNPEVQAAAMKEIHAALAGIGQKGAVLRGNAPPKPSERMSTTMRNLADQHRAKVMPASQTPTQEAVTCK